MWGECGYTIHPDFVMGTVVCTLVCGLTLSWRSNTSDIFLWDRLDEGLHSEFTVSRVPCHFPMQEDDENNNFLMPKTVAMIFSADCSFLNFSFLGDVM
jgi:hypothetical protein